MMFSIYLILLTAIILYFFLHVENRRFVKLLAIIVLLHGYLTIGGTLEEISGYPTAEPMTSTAQVIWGVAYEPVVAANDPGYIDLWVQYSASYTENKLSFFSLAESGVVSRIHRIPYTKDNHEALQSILTRLVEGKHIGIIVDKNTGTGFDLSEAQQRYSIIYNSVNIKK